MFKRIWVVIVNVTIMLSMLLFVVLYSTFESKNTAERQVKRFENTTTTMEHVTENYLEGEQRICDVWAHYINSENMTIEEAASFIRISHVLPNASAHIVYTDTLSGLSTRTKSGAAENCPVSYNNIDLLADTSWIHEVGTSISISRAYTNPVNGVQSIAFCNFVTLHDGTNSRQAILLRILPVSEFSQKCFDVPKEQYENVELCIIDANGNYIIKGNVFKNSSFFEFYKSYNKIDFSEAEEFFKKITTATETASFTMINS